MTLDFFEGFRRIKLILQVIVLLFIPFGVYWSWQSNEPEHYEYAYKLHPESTPSQKPEDQLVIVNKKEYNLETHKYEPKSYVFPLDASKDDINCTLWWNYFWQNVRIFFEIVGCGLLSVLSLEVVFRLGVWVLKGFAPKHPKK